MKRALPIIGAIVGIVLGILIYLLASWWAAPSIQDEEVVSANIGASFLGVFGVALAIVSVLALLAVIISYRHSHVD